MPDYRFTARARQHGKTSEARAAYAEQERRGNYRWTRAGRPRSHAIDAGVVADPILFTEDDLRALSPGELRLLEQTVFLPGVTVYQIDGFGRRQIEIRSNVPCVTTLPARAR